jgi:hypothetical protein
MLAHIAGVPVEEWLTPVVTGGTGFFLALRAVLLRRRDPRSSR